MKTITHEFVNFNADHLAKFTIEEFIKEFENTPVYEDYSPEDRQRLLQEAHAECQKAVGKDQKPAEPAKPEKPAKAAKEKNTETEAPAK